MHARFKLFVLLRTCYLCVTLAFCGQTFGQEIVDPEPDSVRIANGEYAPYFSEDLKHYGVGSRIVKAAFAEVGINVDYVFRPWERGYRNRNLLRDYFFSSPSRKKDSGLSKRRARIWSSTKSTRRSPASILDMKDWGRPSCWATCPWVSFASSLACRNFIRKRRYAAW